LKRVCFVLHIREDRLAEYRERHRDVWPEMLDALRDCGWNNYSLFLRPDGLLVGYLETNDFERALAEMAKRDVNRRWQQQMAPFFLDREGGAAPDQMMTPIEEIFHLGSV
jgi:L-rhamnose mutarotase